VSEPITVALELAKRLYNGGVVTTAFIREEFGVSPATAKRYMVRLECALPVLVEKIPNGFSVRYGTSTKLLRLMNAGGDSVAR
jgi:hypothetical protein